MLTLHQKGDTMQKKLIVMLAICLVLAYVMPAAAQDIQLLQNPGFETWTNGPSSPPDHWININADSISATREASIFHGGAYSTNLTWITPTQAQCDFLSDPVPVIAGSAYACTLWAVDNDLGGRITISLRYDVGNYYPSIYTVDSPNWQALGMTHTAPVAATSVRVGIRCYDYGSWDGSSTVYVDDVHLWGPEVTGNIPPSITNVLRYPYPIINPPDNAVVTATIMDTDGIVTTDSLYRRVFPGSFSSVFHDSIAAGSNYWFTIGPHSAGDSIEYYVVATDDDGARSQSPTRGYTVAGATPPSHVPIYAIQHTTTQGDLPNCFPSDSINLSQTVTGIVVGRYERTGGTPPYRSRFLMQDATTPWSGLNVYYAPTEVQVGDSVTVTGSIMEYFAETELQAVTVFTNHSSGHTLPAPAVLTCATFSADSCSATAEPYEGMIIQINNITVGDSANYGGLWAYDATGDSTIIQKDLYQGGDNPPTITIGQTYSYVRGIGRYIRGRYRIAPRFASDVYTAPIPCTGGTIFDVEFTFDPGSDTADCWPSPDTGQFVTICGVTTAVTQGTVPRFYLQDQNNPFWSGIYCYDYTIGGQIALGDLVQVTGRVKEYYGWTEIDSVSAFSVLGSGQPLPDTALITIAYLDAMCDYGTESYENILVQINNVAVVSDNGFGEMWIRDSSSPDSIRIDSDLWQYGTDQPSPLPAPGTNYDYVIGVVKWEGRQGLGYDRGWVILPRFASDYHQTVFTEPEITEVWSVNSTTLAVGFDRVMRPAEVEIPGNYSTTHGLSITGAVISTDGRKVTLTTGAQPNSMIDSLRAVNLCDNLGTCMTVPHYGLFHSGLTPISAIQTPAADGDTSQYYMHVVTFKGVIVSDSTMAHPTNLWINDQSGPPYNGVLIYTGGLTGSIPMMGDTTTMTARVEEYYDATEMTGLANYNNVVIHGSGPEPVPYQATVAELNANREAFEGVLVTVCDSFIITNLSPDTSVLQYGFMVRKLIPPLDSFIVHYQPPLHTRYAYVPVVGAHINGITGVYKFQRWQYRISPRRDADINSFDTWCAGGPGCDYVPGDINGNGSANGIDVTYGVSYLKGGGAPRDSCNCPPLGYPFYAAMDVNGNCAANGIDITYFVAYLKGLQPQLRYCAGCPPARQVAPGTEIPSIKPSMKARTATVTKGKE